MKRNRIHHFFPLCFCYKFSLWHWSRKFIIPLLILSLKISYIFKFSYLKGFIFWEEPINLHSLLNSMLFPISGIFMSLKFSPDATTDKVLFLNSLWKWLQSLDEVLNDVFTKLLDYPKSSKRTPLKKDLVLFGIRSAILRRYIIIQITVKPQSALIWNWKI